MTSQLEQLLTCCICLDRFRNPKLLPCQHSVCMEPCMEGLVDYVRRQVKCPECRAEHRLPYNGVQGFPANVTLQRFLEAHIEITGETPDPHTGQIMERCAVCNEKNYLSVCAHCEKKICTDCKAAHTEILKREIGRINNQVKRAVHRLNDQLNTIERNITALKNNTNGVSDEIENISKRLQKAVRDRCQNLKAEVENYYNTELRNMTHMKEGLDQEISNIDSNIELAEKHMDDQTPWDDCELMDTKDIFLKTMEFIRSFDYEPGMDYNRRARFSPPDDINKLATQLATLGELVIQQPKQMNDSYGSDRGMGPGLMKSKSDHRLAAQFRDNDDSYSYGSGRTSPVPRHRFGDRPVATDRYDGHDSAYDSPSESGRRRFRSRFMRRGEDEEEKSVRFADTEDHHKRQIRVMDTEDVSRGPLSGILRLFDSPRVLKRLQERDTAPKKKEEPPKPAQSTMPKTPTTPQTPTQRKTSRQVSNEDEIDKIKKQNKATESTTSSAAVASTPSTPTSPSMTTTTTSRPDSARVSSLRDEDRVSRADRTSVSPRSSSTHSPTSSVTRDDDSTPSTVRTRREYGRATVTGSPADYSATGTGSSRTTPARKTSVDTGPLTVSQRSYPFSRSSSTSSVGESTKTSGTRSPRQLDTTSLERRLSRSNSTDSNKSHDGSTSPRKSTGAAFSTDELRNRFSRGADTKSTTSSRYSTDTTPSTRSGAGSSRFHSRFLARAGTPSAEASKELGNDDDEEEESSDDSESEESEESSEEDEEEEKDEVSSPYARSDGWPLGRSAQNRDSTSSSSKSSTAAQEKSFTTAPPSSNDSGYSSRYGSSSDNSSASSSSRYGTSSANSSTNSNSTNDSSSSGSYRRPSSLDASRKEKEEDFDSRYPLASKYLSRSRANMPEEETTTKPTFQSRFLNRSKSSAVLGPDATNDDESSGAGTSTMGAGRARFEELKERRQRLARSKSSAGLDDDETSTSTDTPATSSYRSSRFGRDNDTTSPTSPRTSTSGATGGDDSGSSTSQLSNWARYLKNKYGNRSTGTSGVGSTTPGLGSSSATGAGSSGLGTSSLGSARSSGTSSPSTSTSRPISRSRSSHLLGLAKEGESSEDDSKNVHATPTTQAAAGTQVPTPFASLHRSQYLQKQRLLLKIGSRGSEPGNFTWPRGIAVGPDNSIVVADSSNHRVQVFDQSGSFVKEFGSYGSGEGEFDCLAGVAVNRIGQFIIADRYNHRIQVFDPSGMFLRAFGSQGSGDGKFSYPWGVTTDALGFIYVCDKENHRVQVFQSDGTFVGKFGSMGNKPGQLEHPHYIAVSSTNRVIVSDSNNHRIQVFDINGKVTTTFGAEGSDEGQFKFPRGVAVDDQGYIFVADSGNNRIQIFHPDGSFLRAFGCWGSGEGEFKGLEGVAVMSNGNILVCDRENHRIQVF